MFAVMGVPTLLFLLPILDTSMVALTRILRGQSPLQGGKDHTSHRLIAFGLNERQAVLVLYAVALLSGIMAAFLESIQYWFSLVLVPLLVISLTLLAAYLGGLKIIPSSSPGERSSRFTRIVLDLTIKWRLLEVLLDFFLIGFAYYLALLTYYRFSMNEIRLGLFLGSLPFALGVTLFIFYLFGIYRGLWRYLDFRDLGRYSLASASSSLVLGGVLYLINKFYGLPWSEVFPENALFLFSIYILFTLAASRASFRLLDNFKNQRLSKYETRVLIIGAGDSAEMALRLLQMEPQLHFQPIGIVDNDPFRHGKQVHGVQIIGDTSQLSHFLHFYKIQGVILGSLEWSEDDLNEIQKTCKEYGCWVKRLRYELDDF